MSSCRTFHALCRSALVLAGVSLCLIWGAEAHAQEAPGTPVAQTPTDQTPVEQPPVEQPPVEQTPPPPPVVDQRSLSEQAAERFKLGIQLFEDGDFALALVELERAYELSPNYRALYNIALVNVQLGHYARATESLRRYLAEGGDKISPERQAEMRALLQDLTQRTASITIIARTPGVEIRIDGKGVDGAALSGPLLVDPGEHTLEARAPGFVVEVHTLKLASQDAARLEIKLDVARPETGPRDSARTAPPERRVFWPGVAVSAALAGGALASGIVSTRSNSDLDALKEKPVSSQSEREDLARRANISAVATDVLGGLALVGAGVTLYLSLRRVSPDGAPAGVALTGNGVSLRGKF